MTCFWGATARARPRIRTAALTDRQTDTAPRPSAHLLGGRRPAVDAAAASRGQEPQPALGGGVEGVGARGVVLKLFVQLLGCSRSGGAVVRAGAAEPSGTGRSASPGREEPPSEEEGEEEEEKEEERGPRWRLGARQPGSWTGEAAVCADSAPAARAPQALARASAPGARGARLGDEESGPPRSPSRRGSASRAGPGRASETMNFLLSWVHWSLALLLYLHHAKVSGRPRPAPRAAASASPGWGRASARARGGSVPHAGPWAPGARLPPPSLDVEGEGARARWEGTGASLAAHAGPAHPPDHRTYDLGRPAEGGSRWRRPRGLGLRCRLPLKFAPGRWSPTN